MAHDVFISYSHFNQAAADAVCAGLEAAAVRCWIASRDIEPGADWAESIIAAISASRAPIVLLSSHANKSVPVAALTLHTAISAHGSVV